MAKCFCYIRFTLFYHSSLRTKDEGRVPIYIVSTENLYMNTYRFSILAVYT